MLLGKMAQHGAEGFSPYAHRVALVRSDFQAGGIAAGDGEGRGATLVRRPQGFVLGDAFPEIIEVIVRELAHRRGSIAWKFSWAWSLPGFVRSKMRSEEHTSELQSQSNLVCRLLLEKKKN